MRGHPLNFFFLKTILHFPRNCPLVTIGQGPVFLATEHPTFTVNGDLCLDGFISLNADCSQIKCWAFLFTNCCRDPTIPTPPMPHGAPTQGKRHRQNPDSWLSFNLTRSHQPAKMEETPTTLITRAPLLINWSQFSVLKRKKKREQKTCDAKFN